MRAGFRQLPGIRTVLDRMSSDGRPLLRRLVAPPPLQASPRDESEALDHLAAHALLLRRHGARRVLAYYEQQLWPDLMARPQSRRVGQALVDVAMSAIETAVRYGPFEKVIGWGNRAADALAVATLGDSPAETMRARRRVAGGLTSRMRDVIRTFVSHGRRDLAVRAFQMIERLGPLNPGDKRAYARLLWDAGDKGRAAVGAYVNSLTADPDAIDQVLPAMREFVRASTAIDEHTPPELVSDRLVLNHALVSRFRETPDVLRSLGLGYLMLHKGETALRYLEDAQRLADSDGADSFYVAQAYFDLERFPEASAAFQRATRNGYNRARIAAWQALSLAKSGRYQHAIAEFEAAESQLGADSLTSEFFVYWGRACYLHGSLDEAIARFWRALELNQGDWRAVNGLVICLDATGHGAEARALLRERIGAASQSGCPASSAYLFGRLLQADGELPEAAMHYRLAVHARDDDPQYLLALAFALDDLGEADASAILERVADSSAAGAEVYRRLALAYFRQGDRRRARRWIERLCQSHAASEASRELFERDLVTQAVDAFNDRRYAEAAALLQRVSGRLASGDDLRQKLSLALVHDAWVALRTVAPDAAGRGTIRAQIERASQIWWTPEGCFVAGFFDLVGADFPSARDKFGLLAGRHPERGEYSAFLTLSALLAGDEAPVPAAGRGTAEMADVGSFIVFFQAQAAARNGNYAEASARFQLWADDAAAVRRLALPRDQVNAFAATCVRLGAQRARDVPRTFARLSERYGDDYWDFAAVFVKHHDLASKGAAEATQQKIDECEAAYRDLMQRASSSDSLASLTFHYARWLEFQILFHLERRDVASALAIFGELVKLPGGPSPTAARLRDRLEARVGAASHEAAYAVLRTDPDRARAIWEEIVQRNPDDLNGLHHLACCHWSRAHDRVREGRLEASMPDWRAGLEYYRQLYAREEYWHLLREKGRRVIQPGKPFNEDAFDRWRLEAPMQLGRTLLDLAIHAVNELKDKGVRPAAAAMALIRASGLDAEVKDRLSDELAARRLDPDPTHLPDFQASTSRAEQVIDIDDGNVKARSFLLRAVTHRAHTLHAEGDRNLPPLVKLLDGVKRHALWLEDRLAAAGERRGDLVQDLVSYYDELADFGHRQGQEAVSAVNAAIRRFNSSPSQSVNDEVKRSLQALKTAYRSSDAAASKALQLEPADFKATAHITYHREQYPSIDEALSRAGG